MSFDPSTNTGDNEEWQVARSKRRNSHKPKPKPAAIIAEQQSVFAGKKVPRPSMISAFKLMTASIYLLFLSFYY